MEPRGRKLLRYGLGFLWIIDGLLQAQPDMFTADFYALNPPKIMESLLQAATDGQPVWFAHFMDIGIKAWGHFPVFFNIGAIILQIAIGLALLFGRQRTLKAGLWLSVFWGFGVWIFGEGAGGILGDGPNYFEGFPGAAILYVIGAVLLLLPLQYWSSGRIYRGLRICLCLVWIAVFLFQAIPSHGFWKSGTLMGELANASSLPQPYFLAVWIQAFALWTQVHAAAGNLIFMLFMLFMSVVSLRSVPPRWLLWMSMTGLFWSWWFAQDFGGVFSGMGTDLNSIPLIGLLMVVGWSEREYKAVKHGRVIHYENLFHFKRN